MKRTCIVEFSKTLKRKVAIEIEIDPSATKGELYAEIITAADDIPSHFIRLDESDEAESDIEVIEEIESLDELQDDEAGKCLEFDDIRFRELYD